MAIIRSRIRTICFLASLFTTMLLVSTAHTIGQETAEELFPTDSSAWLNSPPISLESLKDKAAILYFFEEG